MKFRTKHFLRPWCYFNRIKYICPPGKLLLLEGMSFLQGALSLLGSAVVTRTPESSCASAVVRALSYCPSEIFGKICTAVTCQRHLVTSHLCSSQRADAHPRLKDFVRKTSILAGEHIVSSVWFLSSDCPGAPLMPFKPTY